MPSDIPVEPSSALKPLNLAQQAAEQRLEEATPPTPSITEHPYFRFYDLRRYVEVAATSHFTLDPDGNEKPVMEFITIVDEDETRKVIEAAEARSEARRARKGRPTQEHTGFNRSMRRGFMKRLPRKAKAAFKRQYEASKKVEEITEPLDKPTEVVV
jgi:hypothetical protein